MSIPCVRRLRASLFLPALALWALALPGTAADFSPRTVVGADYASVREALLEAVEFEGLIPQVAPFGDMLRRTEADIGHGGDIYAQAEIVSFCSILAAARLVREDPDNIADCPMTIALYQLKGSPRVRLVYRQRAGETAGSRSANDLLERILGRVAGMLPGVEGQPSDPANANPRALPANHGLPTQASR